MHKNSGIKKYIPISVKENIKYLLWQISKIYYYAFTKKHNNKINIKKCKRLLIIAHPDDEMIFFDNYLKKNSDTLVICLTNGGNRTRTKEFLLSMNYYSSSGIILNFRDSINCRWNEYKLFNIIMKLYTEKEWVDVLTHNEEGEYGHNQHILVNKIVKKVCCGRFVLVPLLASERFLSRNLLNKDDLKEKEEIFRNIYKSQKEGILNKNDIYYKHFIYEKVNYL